MGHPHQMHSSPATTKKGSTDTENTEQEQVKDSYYNILKKIKLIS